MPRARAGCERWPRTACRPAPTPTGTAGTTRRPRTECEAGLPPDGSGLSGAGTWQHRAMGARRVAAAAVASGCVLAGLLTSGATAAGPTTYTIRPSVNQLYVLDATPGAELSLVHDGSVVGTGTVDSLGSLAWRELEAGTYSVREEGTESGPVAVTDFDGPPPAQSFYDGQTLSKGFNYITTRDGTTLSAEVSLPGGPGPFPTVAGY